MFGNGMMTKFDKYNESIRDLMKPKSEEEIKKSLDKLSPDDKLRKGITMNLSWSVEDALKNGANPNLTYPNSSYPKDFTCLMKTVLGDCDRDIIYFLIKYGADVNARTKNGTTALDIAEYKSKIFSNNRNDLVYYLIKSYVDKTNESIMDLMKPKSAKEIKLIWAKYWGMKQLLHDTYPANAYAVLANGGLSVNWNTVGRSVGYDNLPQVQNDIIKLLKDNGFEKVRTAFGDDLFKIIN
jgi:ankyrin repeat protein